MSQRLQGKNIIVTGATGAIGKEAAFRLAAEGATVILMARKENALNQIYDIIVNRGGPQPAIIQMDFTKVSHDDYFGLAHNLALEFGHIDGVVHSAINLGNLAPLAHTEPAKWELSLELALNTPFYLTQALLPLLHNANDRTSIIFFEHNEVATGKQAYWGSYAIAKAGLRSLRKLFALEFESEQKIQFNSIDPVCVNSVLRYSVSPEGAKDTRDLKEICDLIVKLNDTKHEYINGQLFTL